MSPWVETLGVLLLAAVGLLAGAWFSRLRRPFWMIGYLMGLTLMVMYILGSRDSALAVIPPISWMMSGRNKFAVIGFIAPLLLTVPLLKLPRRRDRLAVASWMVLVVALGSVWPFLAPAFNRQYLAGLVTRMDGNGICRQNSDYTCGPAAAVTALRQLGFPAEEGELAILAHTSSAIGTPPDILAEALRQRYGQDGLECELRVFNDVAELKNSGLVLAVVKYNFFLDHFVTVLEVNDREVVVGDPLLGLTKLTPSEFEEEWYFVGLVMRRK